MHSMKHQDTLVIGGVDSHADTHHAAAMDKRGALLATKGFPTTTPGYRELLDWLRAFGEVDVVAVESTGSYALRRRYLREHGVRVLEVNQPHAHTRRRRGKSDPIDAEMAARLALSGKATTVPKQTDWIVESIRACRAAARHSAVKSRSAAIVQLGALIISAPQELRDQPLCSQDDPWQGHALSPAASVDRRAFPTRSRRQVRAALHRPAHRGARRRDRRPRSTARAARPRRRTAHDRAARDSTGHAGRLLVTAGENIERLRGEGSVCRPLRREPSPGLLRQTNRHRLNYGGDRQANRTLHLIVVCRLRYCERSRAYANAVRRKARASRKSCAA